MIGYRTGQVVSALRQKGIRSTIALVRKTRQREAGASVPLRERFWLARHGFKPISFVLYQFAGRPRVDRDQFLSDLANNLLTHVNGLAGPFLENKLIFHRLLERSQIKIPTLLAVLRRGRLVDARPPYAETDWRTIFDNNAAVFVKPPSGNRGVGVRLLRNASEAESLKVWDDMIVVGKVEQAQYARVIFPDASNTVRVVAMREPVTREIFIPVAVHRFGARDTAPVDNWSRGGLSCPINLATGELGPGIRHPSMSGWKMKQYDHHPDTGAPVAGIRIANWKSLAGTVNELMRAFPDLEYVAWDMLSTDDGWCAIEGNHGMDVDLLQIHGGLLADERVRGFVKHYCPGELLPR
jgi:hypothetical protein